jgi:hypothetical protein
LNGKYVPTGKVVPVLNYAMKAYGGVDVYIHIIFASALVGGEWLASHPLLLYL